ncbi:37S ribosomal protein S9, mitochondrial [Paraconiothyrium brasiliense]|uniref:Small ribosomal subunit protein uS9m n=1 Tax=Paraconiothyrium brasiliense TaxID=300254 RepID=A0ABR3QJI0_9PLEO
MVRGELSRSIWSATEGLLNGARPQCTRTMRLPYRSLQPAARFISTTPSRSAEITSENPESTLESFTAAPEFEFDMEGEVESDIKIARNVDKGKSNNQLLRTLRIVPASRSYFSAKPTFNDDFIHVSALLRSVATLPTIPNSEAPRVAWKTIDQYRIMTNEPVKTQRFHRMMHLVKRLNCVHPSLMPEHVRTAMRRFMKDSQPGDIVPVPQVVDEWGRARGVGRRKTSSAVVWLVEGEGEVLVNGKSLSQFFGRLHHRESAVWALKATQRLDKYNMFGLVQGGGSTGQAEALTLAVAKALMVHEPALKPALRRAGCVTRDPRKVERKKTGHIKARKMPTWVKR